VSRLRRGGRPAQAGFGLAVLVHLVVLYAPRAPAAPGPVWIDKVVHVTIFAAVALAAAWAGLPRRPVALLLLGHAVISELLQWLLLPGRSGDPWDSVADAAGVALAAVLGLGVRLVAGSRAPR
jgi:hypothetical protein